MDIRSFFSPPGAKQKQNGVKGTSSQTKSDEKRGHKKPSKGSESSSSDGKGSKGRKQDKKPKTKRAVVLSDSDDDKEEFIKTKKKKTSHSKKGVVADTDSDEEPLPQKIREVAGSKEKSSKSKKRATYFDESDEESPIKHKSTTRKESKKVTPVKPKTPEKQMTSAADFFGSEPVHRSAKKTLPVKRKQPVEDQTEEPFMVTEVKDENEQDRIDDIPSHPSKKRKEEHSPSKKSPIKSATPTLANKLSKAATASKTLIPETPPVKSKPSPSKAKTSPTIKKPKTPEKVQADDSVVVAPPASLEKKKSGYRNFMSREGPRALGSKEIPQGADNCFEGLTFVITGVLDSIERDHAQDLIQRYGGKVTGSVSKKTSYVVVGRDPGVSKISKAETLGTKQIDEDGLFDLIRNTPGKKSAYECAAESPATKSKAKGDRHRADSRKVKGDEPSKVKREVPSKAKGAVLSNSQESVSSSPMTQTPSGSPSVKVEDSLMWVDKYKPNTIKQIIGQQGDKSNMRKLMNWVSNWHNNRTKKHPKASFFSKDSDGAVNKAALLSGPPGVGKTTTATLVCKELGYTFIEMNASDSRSKKTLEQVVSESLTNKSMDAFVGGSARPAASSGLKHVLLMDEVDGMAGNEDRGGMQELISLIKKSKIPVICMCNDRNSQKIRSLANYCFDLRFARPRVEQIKGAMMSIAYKEGLKIPPPAMDQIIHGANQDVRQVLHNLSMWTSTNKNLTYDQAKANADKAHKDIKMGPFDAVRKLLSIGESSKLSLIDKSDLFFCDYSLMPLFVQENYLAVNPAQAGGDIKKSWRLASRTADAICDGDLVSKRIRTNNSWSLLPMQAMFSAVMPSQYISGGLGQRVDFPQWLGKNSKQGRLDRILQELQAHMRISTSADKSSVNLEYVPHLRRALTSPLTEQDPPDLKERISRVIGLLEAYHLTREDWDSVMEVGLFDGHRDPMSSIPSKTKSAFTRTYNKEAHKTPYAIKGSSTKSRKGGASDEPGVADDEVGDEVDEDDEDESLDNSAMLVKSKKPTKAGASSTKAGASSGKGGASTGKGGGGKGKGKGKGKKS